MDNKPEGITPGRIISHFSNIQNRIKEGSHSFTFSREELLAGTERFLKHVGYDILPTSQLGSVWPYWHGRRAEGRKVYQIIGMAHTHLKQADEGFVQLAKIQASLGDNADYVLVLPPIQEFHLIQFLTADKGKWFYDLKRLGFMMWLYNPQRKAMWCIMGTPKDRLFASHFVVADRPIDPYIAMLLSKELIKDETF